MSHEDLEVLIPEYVSGTLDETGRLLLAQHLDGCSSCRELADVCQTLSRQLPGTQPNELLAHVQVRHLDRWTRDRASMPGHLDRWIADHLSSCQVCSEASQLIKQSIAQDTTQYDPSTGGTGGDEPGSSSPWFFFTRTLFGPVAAAAYLIVASVLLGIILTGETTLTPEGVLPPAQAIYPPEDFRSGQETEDGPVPVNLDGAWLHLQIHTDAQDTTGSFLAELSSDGNVLWSRSVAATDISEFGVLNLLIPTSALKAGQTVELVIRPDTTTPGAEPVFSRALQITP